MWRITPAGHNAPTPADASSASTGTLAARLPSPRSLMAPLDRPLLTQPATADFQLSAELRASRDRARDRSLPLVERLDAFEDLFESEVGDTPLLRARNVERACDLRQIYLKFEGGNPSGTQKDRIAFAQVMDALRQGYERITVATCGNYGVAIALAASLAGLECEIFVPERYHTRRVTEMERYQAKILRGPKGYEETVDASREHARTTEAYDANPGGVNEIIQLQAYGQIAYEIYDELRDAPLVCAVPVSNGTVLAGIHRGFQSLHRRGKTSRMPRMIAGSARNANPIVAALSLGLDSCEDLPPESVRETATNEPLVNWHSIDGELALQAVRTTRGWGHAATDKRMKDMARLLRDQQGLEVLPASTAGLIALVDAYQEHDLAPDRYVAVLTGRGR